MIIRTLLLLAVLASLPPAAGAAPATLPFEDVRPGMRGTGRTVFSGTEVQTFDVEILGTLPRIGPDRNLILARCSGGPLAETGILAGMSGSPVTVEGKLIGAVAYSWGFSTEAIAGITPIGEMLAIPALEDNRLTATGAWSPGPEDWRRLTRPESVPRFLDSRLRALLPGSGPFPLSVPLSVSGPGVGAGAWLSWAEGGFLPVQGGRVGSEDGADPGKLVPGSAVGLKLVRGDVEVAATGTVTWVDGDKVLAFGHPLLNLGTVDLPMTTASVRALLPNLQQSARLALPLREVGSIRQDRVSGVFGLLGAAARTIPVRLQLESPDRAARTFSFDMVADPLLSPLLLFSTLGDVLTARERAVGPVSLRLREGSIIKLDGGEDVTLDNLFSGTRAVLYGTGITAYVLHLLMNNAWSSPDVAGVNLIYEYDPTPRDARIRRVMVDRRQVHAGDTVAVSVVLSPYRGPDQVLSRELRIPAETPPGNVTLHVGGAALIHGSAESAEPLLPRDMAQLVRLINQLRRNDKVYMLATLDDAGVMIDGTQLPNLPPSVALVLSPPSARDPRRPPPPPRLLAEEAIATDWAVIGGATLRLQVLAR